MVYNGPREAMHPCLVGWEGEVWRIFGNRRKIRERNIESQRKKPQRGGGQLQGIVHNQRMTEALICYTCSSCFNPRWIEWRGSQLKSPVRWCVAVICYRWNRGSSPFVNVRWLQFVSESHFKEARGWTIRVDPPDKTVGHPGFPSTRYHRHFNSTTSYAGLEQSWGRGGGGRGRWATDHRASKSIRWTRNAHQENWWVLSTILNFWCHLLAMIYFWVLDFDPLIFKTWMEFVCGHATPEKHNPFFWFSETYVPFQSLFKFIS